MLILNNYTTIQAGPSEWIKVKVPYYSVIKIQNGTSDKGITVQAALGVTAPTYMDSGFRVSDNRILDFYLGGEDLYIKASAKTLVTVHWFPISRKNGLNLQMSVFETIRNVDNFIIKVPAGHTFTVQNVGVNNINVLGNCQFATDKGMILKQHEYLSLDTGQETHFSVNGSGASFSYSIVNAFNSDSIVGPIGPAGADGTNGLSAYELDVRLGYNGTLEQWLEMTRGPKDLRHYSAKITDLVVGRFNTTGRKQTDVYAFVADNKNLLYPLNKGSQFSVRISGMSEITLKGLDLYGAVTLDDVTNELPIIDGVSGRAITIDDVVDGTILNLRVDAEQINGTLNGHLTLLESMDEFELTHTLDDDTILELLELKFQ